VINWIDIVSPRLRQLHRDWLHYRGSFMMPEVQAYNAFADIDTVTEAAPVSATVVLPAQGQPVFKHVGAALRDTLPGCRSGMSFAELAPPLTRAAATGPFMRITHSRQPEARRLHGSHAGNDVPRDNEMLLLPFGDSKLRVCIVHAVYDLGGINWKKAFA
jgi:hypothetical protein